MYICTNTIFIYLCTFLLADIEPNMNKQHNFNKQRHLIKLTCFKNIEFEFSIYIKIKIIFSSVIYTNTAIRDKQKFK